MKNERYFISGIGTSVGKTFTSAALCKAFHWEYWKPLQCGELNQLDSDFVRFHNPGIIIHPEQLLLQHPLSPHLAAEKENVKIRIEQFKVPIHHSPLLIEGAGGLLVPFNSEQFLVDCVEAFQAELILVIDFYLGSINHSLLSLEYLKFKEIPVKGIVYNRPDENLEFIRSQHQFPEIGVIQQSNQPEINLFS